MMVETYEGLEADCSSELKTVEENLKPVTGLLAQAGVWPVCASTLFYCVHTMAYSCAYTSCFSASEHHRA